MKLKYVGKILKLNTYFFLGLLHYYWVFLNKDLITYLMNALISTNQSLRLRNVLTNKISRLTTWSLTKDHPSFHSSPMWCPIDVKSSNKMYISLYHKIKILHSSWTKQKINGQHHLPHICILDIKNKHSFHITMLQDR